MDLLKEAKAHIERRESREIEIQRIADGRYVREERRREREANAANASARTHRIELVIVIVLVAVGIWVQFTTVKMQVDAKRTNAKTTHSLPIH